MALGLALLALALLDKPDGTIGGVELHELVLGLVVFPAVSVAVGLLARRYHDGPLRFTGAAGIAANFAVIVVLIAVPYTSGAAALFYGVTLLAAAWRGDPGCEGTLVSNVILGRDDQVGCPCLTPVDGLEARHKRGVSGASSGHA